MHELFSDHYAAGKNMEHPWYLLEPLKLE